MNIAKIKQWATKIWAFDYFVTVGKLRVPVAKTLLAAFLIGAILL